jgi:hypothetical protein
MNPPEITEHGMGWKYSWPIEQLEITVDALREKEGGVYAEMTISAVLDNGNAPLTIQTLQLTSVRSKSDLANHLSTTATGIPKEHCKAFIEYASTHSVQRHRQGEPVLTMNGRAPISHIPWRLNPLVLERMPTVVFAPGGTGKSYLALFAGLLTVQGGPFLGTDRPSRLNAVQGACLYLDWEASPDAFQLRLSRLVAAHPDLANCEIQYLSMRRPLPDDLLTVQRHVKQYDVKLLILDSLALASGGELNGPQSAIQFFPALRSLNCSSLILAHVSKNADSGKSIYGSVFFSNLARSTFEVESSQDEGSLIKRLVLRHAKTNETAKQAPMAFSFDFGHASGGVRVEPIGMEDLPSQEATQSDSDKIRAALSEGPKNYKELELATGLPTHTLRSRCSDGQKKNWCMKIEDRWHLVKVHL